MDLNRRLNSIRATINPGNDNQRYGGTRTLAILTQLCTEWEHHRIRTSISILTCAPLCACWGCMAPTDNNQLHATDNIISTYDRPFNQSSRSSRPLAWTILQKQFGSASGPPHTLQDVRPPLARTTLQKQSGPGRGSHASRDNYNHDDDYVASPDQNHPITAFAPTRLRGTTTHTTSDGITRADVRTGLTEPITAVYNYTRSIAPSSYSAEAVLDAGQFEAYVTTTPIDHASTTTTTTNLVQQSTTTTTPQRLINDMTVTDDTFTLPPRSTTEFLRHLSVGLRQKSFTRLRSL